MGEARRKGTFEERKQAAQIRSALDLEERNKRIEAMRKEQVQVEPFVKGRKGNKAFITAAILMAGLGAIKK